MREPYNTIDRVLLTEKGTRLQEKENQYLFRVALNATKAEIRQAVEKLFNVRVLQVNTLVRGGKKKRERTAHFGHTSDWKRAVVSLKEGDTINLS